MAEKSKSTGAVRFKGKPGQFIRGIPARDLTMKEWTALPLELRIKGAGSGLYDGPAPTKLKSKVPESESKSKPEAAKAETSPEVRADRRGA